MFDHLDDTGHAEVVDCEAEFELELRLQNQDVNV